MVCLIDDPSICQVVTPGIYGHVCIHVQYLVMHSIVVHVIAYHYLYNVAWRRINITTLEFTCE